MIRIFSVFLIFLCSWICVREATALDKPNVLFIIADDASRHFGQSYACSWAHTPNIDQIANVGLVFDNAYTPTSKCAPSRAAILTGRNPWQLEDAANHQPYFPAKFRAFTEVLNEAGVHCGGAGKTWGPGEAKTSDGKARDFGLTNRGGNRDAVGSSFKKFLIDKPKDQPFFYWYGSKNPHRPYKLDAGIAAGKKTHDIDRVPAYWPDNDLVRRDMLDYATEIEAFDAQVGELLSQLRESGYFENTLVIVTSDHGMPFPRVKGHTFDDAHHIPLVMSWPNGIRSPRRRVTELVSFIDLAPTILNLMGLDGERAGMSKITGNDMIDLLQNDSQKNRSFAIVGRERNDVLCRPGSPAGLGYPARGIRMGQFFYVHNFEPDRWPCGNPDVGFKDTDASPSKALAEQLGPSDPFWQHAFGKRPQDQLFDLTCDPDCVHNLADVAMYASQKASMKEKLMLELAQQQDPRVLGRGSTFDHYLSPRALTPSKPTTEK